MKMANGYRRMRVGEKLREGDEYYMKYMGKCWHTFGPTDGWSIVPKEALGIYRRKIKVHTDKRASTVGKRRKTPINASASTKESAKAEDGK